MATAVENNQRSRAAKAAWVCLAIAWICFIVPIPGTGMFIGWPLNLVAFILAIVAMSKDGARAGIIQLLASLIVSPVVYFIGLAVLGAAITSGNDLATKDAETRAEQATAAAAPAAEATAAPVDVDAGTLFAAYDANEIAADAAYKGKVLRVTGVIAGIDSDMMDQPVVQLGTSNMFQTVHAKGLPLSAAAALAKGQRVTLTCTGAGEVIGSPMLEDCKM